MSVGQYAVFVYSANAFTVNQTVGDYVRQTVGDQVRQTYWCLTYRESVVCDFSERGSHVGRREMVTSGHQKYVRIQTVTLCSKVVYGTEFAGLLNEFQLSVFSLGTALFRAQRSLA